MLSIPLCIGFRRPFPNQAKNKWAFRRQSDRYLYEFDRRKLFGHFIQVLFHWDACRRPGHCKINHTDIILQNYFLGARKSLKNTSEIFSFKFARSVASSSLFDIVTILFTFWIVRVIWVYFALFYELLVTYEHIILFFYDSNFIY